MSAPAASEPATAVTLPMRPARPMHREKPPSAAVSFMEEAASDRLSRCEIVLLPKFEHAADGFLPFRRGRRGRGGFVQLSFERWKECILPGHSGGMSAHKKARFDFRRQVKRDCHGYPILSSLLSLAVPTYSKGERLSNGLAQNAQNASLQSNTQREGEAGEKITSLSRKPLK